MNALDTAAEARKATTDSGDPTDPHPPTHLANEPQGKQLERAKERVGKGRLTYGKADRLQVGDVVWYRGDEGMYVDGIVAAVAANYAMYSVRRSVEPLRRSPPTRYL